jgi:hypothetical protein
MKKYLLLSLFITGIISFASAQHEVQVKEIKSGNSLSLSLKNNMVKQTVYIENGRLMADTLQSLPEWTSRYGNRKPSVFVTDADFQLDVVYSAWRAPGKQYNADNPVSFSKKNFVFNNYSIAKNENGTQTVDLYFSGTNNIFTLRISYQLKPEEFFARRKIVLTDSTLQGHYLDKIHTRKGGYVFYDVDNGGEKSSFTISVEGYEYSTDISEEKKEGNTNYEIINKGDFGQPVALKTKSSGAFGGIEYPTSVNELRSHTLDFYQYLGEQIKLNPLESDWAVTGITPEPYVKKWFFQYVKDIRVTPVKPYTLYNSWYDLRSVDYPKIQPDAVMNEENVLRIWNLVKENFIEKNNIQIDAFVLDDGWDIYASDWKLRTKQFPDGLRPIADEMKKSGTDLGIWFGPSGGYSFALKRIQWMHDNGYEVIGNVNKYGSAQLCLAGKNYSKLFRKRTTDFVKNDHIGYFKWDGIQFSCSEPDHGHPVGIYSRRAIMESVIDKCVAVREINPDVYLNITSGTWLSPWWVKYTNQIWMDAADYAFADVPSITRRDNAMTYRDYALFDDEHIRKSWFPISNLMIHGIIKGRLESISKEGESLEKFTNNAVLYFARGISMWELYISPDILKPEEWHVLSTSIQWAKDRFDLLINTFMVGENPATGNAYAYLHFDDNKGIIAARNPKIEADIITVVLDPEYGINEKATGLIVEQVYPKHYIFPTYYAAGARLNIELDGYETAVFEVYPVSEQQDMPLIAGVPFTRKIENGQVFYVLLDKSKTIEVLNPESIETITIDGKEVSFANIAQYQAPEVKQPEFQADIVSKKGKELITLNTLSEKGVEQIAVLLKPDSENKQETFPVVELTLNGKKLTSKTQSIKDKWIWYSADINPDETPDIEITIDKKDWKGHAEVWVHSNIKASGEEIIITPKGEPLEKPMPPLPYPSHEFKKYHKVTELNL